MAVAQSKTVEDVTYVREEMVTFGYMRDILNEDNDYTFIVAIIILFYQQGFAKYFDENIQKDCKPQMRFGDILKTQGDNYMILDINNELKIAGKLHIGGGLSLFGDTSDESHVDINMTIPYSICKHLTNAVSFFSKLAGLEAFRKADDYTLNLDVKHNDQWIVKHFGGPLDSEYKSIRVWIEDGDPESVYICFARNYGQWFDPMTQQISYTDIETYFELRKNSANLAKFQVVLNPDDDDEFGCCDTVSILWERKRNLSMTLAFDDVFNYIGPKTEKD